jgi:hypothetical protein
MSNETIDQINKCIAAIEVRVRAIELRLGINITAADVAPLPPPFDPTARMSLPRSAVEAMTRATDGFDVDIIADGRRRNPMAGK